MRESKSGSITEFASTFDRLLITKQGEFTNGKWLIKGEYVTKQLERRFLTLWYKIQSRQPDSDPIWKYAKESKPNDTAEVYTLVNTGEQYDGELGAGYLRSYKFTHAGTGREFLIQVKYVDYLNKNIKDLNFRMQLYNTGKNAIYFYSGESVAGLIMPVVFNSPKRVDVEEEQRQAVRDAVDVALAV